MDFDWGAIGKVLSYLVPVIIFLVVNIFFKKQQERKREITTVRSLLSEVDYNQKLIEAFAMQWQTKKFKTATWKQNKAKIDYITLDLRDALARAYEIAEEFNQEIDRAKKYNSTSYLSGLRVDRLSKPLTQSEQGLEEWLQLNKGKEKIFKRSRDSAS